MVQIITKAPRKNANQRSRDFSDENQIKKKHF